MKENFIRFSKGAGPQKATERVDIYFKRSQGYIRYSFIHVEYPEFNADNWKIYLAEYLDDSLENKVLLTIDGEWELAVKLIGRDDFSGGFAHGDEIYTSLSFFVDGRYVDIRAIEDKLYFDRLTILEATDIYDPKDHTTLIAKHGKEYIFKNEKLIINQSLDWLVEDTIEIGYMAMFPVSKDVTDRFYTNKDYTVRDIAFGSTIGVSSAFSFDKNFGGRFTVTKYPKPLNSLRYIITDNVKGNYNKQYYVAAENGEKVKAGDRWESSTEYELDYNLD